MSDTGRDALLGGPNSLNTNCCIPQRDPGCSDSTATVSAKRSLQTYTPQMPIVLKLVLDIDLGRLQAFS